ncbi:MAG TPA: PAS domain S-box protein [Bacteroidota bacterium]|nr:PAS domain S-box protein [Bacteroidota bacterium]
MQSRSTAPKDVTRRQGPLSEVDDAFIETLLSVLPMGVDITDLSGTILFATPPFIRQVGTDPVGRKCWDVYRDDRCRCPGCPIQHGFAPDGTKQITSIGMLNGKSFIITHALFQYRGQPAMMKLFQDVTEDFNRHAELLESKERFTRIVEGINDIVYSFHADGLNEMFISSGFEKLTGYSLEEIRLKGGVLEFLAGHVGSSELKQLRTDLEKMKRTFSESLTRTWWMTAKSGKRICFEDRVRPVYEHGKLIRVEGMLRDITERTIAEMQLIEAATRDEQERKRVEKELKESEDRFHTLFDLCPDPILVVAGPTIEYINEAGIRLLGAERREQLAGQPFSDFVDPDSWGESFETAGDQLVPRRAMELTECMYVRRDKTKVQVEVVAAPFKINDCEAVQLVARDISARKSLESTIVSRQKLADLGTLAAGVAHEINSPLQVITGVTQSLSKRIEKNEFDPDHFKKDLEVANRNAWRCVSITRALLTYSRPSAESLEPHGVSELLNEALLLIEHQLKSWSNVFIHTRLGENLPEVLCNRNQMIQVVLNLLTNARDAMPDGGEIWIESRYDEALKQVFIQVQDTGTGIPEHLCEKIFNPFFTTKPLGKGTGLGLSISLGIVKSFGGDLRIARTGPEGTAIVIVMPELSSSVAFTTGSLDGGRYSDRHDPIIRQ